MNSQTQQRQRQQQQRQQRPLSVTTIQWNPIMSRSVCSSSWPAIGRRQQTFTLQLHLPCSITPRLQLKPKENERTIKKDLPLYSSCSPPLAPPLRPPNSITDLPLPLG